MELIKFNCIDDGTCHHQCNSNSKKDCFRINNNCSALSLSNLDNDRNEKTILKTLTEDENWKPIRDII